MKKIVIFLFLVTAAYLIVDAQTCNNWLLTPSLNAAVSIGQLDITGDKVTIEALFNRTQPYLPGGGDNTEGDIVSKHNDFSDVNYLLRPNHAYITTTNGFFGTPDVCPIQLNKTYHVALVYDGSTLKYYRDGILLSQVNATGNLIQNNWLTKFGWYDNTGFTTQFLGYINEVKIWNVARTEAQIRANMTTPLPNPTTQPGLLAYYSFDNLLNKQGNAAFNGTLVGAASINETNPNCAFVIDSCSVIQNDTFVIVNTYTPVLALDNCGNKIMVEDASTFNTGDTVLLIQMKGAVIDSASTSSFGTVTDYKNAGNYEMNIVKGKAGNTIELKNTTIRQYDVPLGRVQLIRVPYFQNYTVTDTLTCLPWDGRKGGVLVLNVANTTTMNGDINVSGRGFRGGNNKNPFSLTLTCNENGFSYPASSIKAADKGESIYEIGFNNAYGKGPNAGGGGGGVGHNSGGGGGGNGGAGGFGGYQLEACGNAPFDNRGLGGRALAYSNMANKIFMGGGGGSGHSDNTGNIDMRGGNGGGIIIIITNTLINNGHKIISNGDGGQQCDSLLNTCHDGSGGGGAAGTVLIKTNSYTNTTDIQIKGGKGADLANFNERLGAGRVGPGGGGSGGITWFSQNSLPGNVTVNAAGGINGVIPPDANNPWGATSGAAGQSRFDLQIPVATTPFKPAIDSVRINKIATSCNTFNFLGLAFVNTGSIQNWQWDFGDNTFAGSQNSTHTYPTAGTYTVKLVVTDNIGCKDSISTTVNTSNASTDFSYQQSTCNPLSVQFFNAGNAVNNPAWLFGDGGSDAGSLNPLHTYPSQGSYTVRYSVQNGSCFDTVTKVITITVVNDDIILTPDTTICFGATKQLRTAPSLSFCWSPTTNLDDPLSPTPVTNTTVPITYYFIAETEGNNIINNGDFTAGNTGFTSGYNFAANNTTEGQYFVSPNPRSWNGGLNACGDHTTGTGNMLLVNGSPVPDVTIWQQSVTVIPNTNYSFSTWIQALIIVNPAQLSFSINGKDVGNLITAPLPACTWTRFYSTWNSGNNTSAIISIINKNTLVQGNDFALDDISFAPVVIKRDSINITIDSPVVKTGNDTLVCVGDSVQLIAAGAVSYNWLPVTGLDNAAISNPVATPADTTEYIVKGTSIFGCTASDTITVFTRPLPVITSIQNSSVCKGDSIQLSATGGTTYTWTPATGLSNAGIANPFASPAITTSYIVKSTNSDGCTGSDTVTININPLPPVTTIKDSAVCLGNSIRLTTSGAAGYSWFPITGLSDPSAGNPVVTPTDTAMYIVKGTDANNCSAFDTVMIYTRQLPIVIAGNDTLVCSQSQVQLTATGAATYNWSPTTGLNNAAVNNPVATPADTLQYYVKGTDIFGCSATDSVTIFTKPLPVITITPDTIVCKNGVLQLSASGAQGYQRSPAAGLSNAGSPDPFVSLTTDTVYYLTATGANNCSIKDSVRITIKPIPVFTISPGGNTCGNKPVQLFAGGGNQYAWSPAQLVSDTGIANPFTNTGSTTTYTVIITDKSCGYADTLNTTITVLPVPDVQVSKSNDIDCSMLSAVLTATGASQYTWSPADALTNNAVANPTASPVKTTLYSVTGTDTATKCSFTDTITVFVGKGANQVLFIPSAFSPNSHSLNNCWRPIYQGQLTGYALSVYNRYGELVFFTRDPMQCWDGKYKGKLQHTSNFVYMVKAKNLCREIFKKGNLLLIQ